MEDNLPILTTKQALEQRVQEYRSIRPCKLCGSHLRRIITRSSNGVACMGCEAVGGLSTGKVNAKENTHNRDAAKTWNKNWGIPVVFGGMNTI